uniref:Uncharacterized protein n=1 Tax=Arundo donax TaxID=35708 RepID=A0A0A8ZWR4_ARUDO
MWRSNRARRTRRRQHQSTTAKENLSAAPLAGRDDGS